MLASLSKTTTAAKVVPVIAILTFFVHLSLSSTTEINGRIASCNYTDLLALAVAVICLAAGGSLLRKAWTPAHIVERDVRWWHAVIGTGLVVLAVVHTLRGLGVIGGPCN